MQNIDFTACEKILRPLGGKVEAGVNAEKKTECTAFFKSVMDQDRCAIVLCNLQHEIVYMNPAAMKRYVKRGGEELTGQSLLNCHSAESAEKIRSVIQWFADSREHNLVYTFRNEKENKDVYMVALRDDGGELIGYYEKHEYRDAETMKQYDLW